MAPLVRTLLLATAPSSVWRSHRQAVPHGPTTFFGRRGSGTINLVARTVWSGVRHHTARAMQRPSARASVQRKGPNDHFDFVNAFNNNHSNCYYFA
jgi:hypothetical protein